ncbi:tripartite tricarboxylate transporter substrate binding protein [Pigmentiphaga soli]|uniref:Tripartite tricarboxylate transporter substrate binding protein n=1 Tax=Pigmentiphaga soli TaxID=1007095 RepID=A0ABP8H9F2_9BURK
MRRFHIFAAGLALAAYGAIAPAEEFPSHPMRMIIPTPAGGGADAIARLLGEKMQERMGQPVVVENRPGGDTIIGTRLVATSPPDGYTMLLTYSLVAVQPSLKKHLPYDVRRDLAPVIDLMEAPSLVTVRNGLPVNTMQDLIALVRAEPGKYSYSDGGTGGPSHLSAELFNSLTGGKLLRVPYKGSAPSLTDLAGGHVDMSFSTIVSAQPYVRTGRMKALAVTGKRRSPVFPELPTVAEAGLPDYEYVTWYGIFVTGGTPKPIVDKLYGVMREIVETPEMKQLFAEQGAQVVGTGPQEFGAYIDGEIKKWARVVKDARIPVDED